VSHFQIRNDTAAVIKLGRIEFEADGTSHALRPEHGVIRPGETMSLRVWPAFAGPADD